MTEQEYIKVKALGTVSASIRTLTDLVQANLQDVIKPGEWEKVLPTLYEWQTRLYHQIEINEKG